MDLNTLRYGRSNLRRDVMEAVIQQALFLFDFLYVHLPLKQSMHSVDPVQALKLLTLRLDEIRTEYDFHRSMMDIFVSVRDLHTNYLLPEPFQSLVAVLPFAIEEYFEGDAPRYVVTDVWAGVQAAPFVPGVEVTHWNGMPMATAVDANAALHAGSNRGARHFQGVRNMTVRPLMLAPLPAEDWVTLTFIGRNGVSEIRVPWRLIPAARPAQAVDPNNRESEAARDVAEPERFLAEVIRILSLLPQHGLILDVRWRPAPKAERQRREGADHPSPVLPQGDLAPRLAPRDRRA